MNRIRLVLADDHTMFAEGLKSLLDEEFELLGTVGNGQDLVDITHRLNLR
jgi:DNA-binding NarL/FixJ family response regulator